MSSGAYLSCRGPMRPATLLQGRSREQRQRAVTAVGVELVGAVGRHGAADTGAVAGDFRRADPDRRRAGRASETSRAVRFRRFSISASVRSILPRDSGAS
jgi:hypothetical protein